MNPRRFDDVAVETAIVAFVGYLDQDVPIALAAEPLDCAVNAGLDSLVVFQSLILPGVEQADDRHHAELVGAVQNALEPPHVVGPQRAVCSEGAVVPRLPL